MASELEKWARIERGFLQDEIKYLKAGGKVMSPSGDDISAAMTEQRCARLEHVNRVLKEVEDAQGT